MSRAKKIHREVYHVQLTKEKELESKFLMNKNKATPSPITIGIIILPGLSKTRIGLSFRAMNCFSYIFASFNRKYPLIL
jgi:hypothetical protein